MTADLVPSPLSRRACLGGIGGFAGLSVWPALQTPAAPPAVAEPALPLFLNLFTRLAAQVQLEPRRTSLFVLDTGAQTTALSDRLATEMRLEAGPDLLVHSVTASRLVPSVRLPCLRLQQEVFEDIITPVFPYEHLGAEGLLGLNHLQAFSLLLDIRQQQAILSPSRAQGVSFTFGPLVNASRIIRCMSPVPGHRQDDLLLLSIKVADIPTIAFLDTGSQYSIGNLRLFQALGLARNHTPERTIFGVSGIPVTVLSGPAPMVEMGIKRIPRAPLLFGDLHIFDVLDLRAQPALMVGADILGYFDRVGIDYHNNRITLGDVMRARIPAG